MEKRKPARKPWPTEADISEQLGREGLDLPPLRFTPLQLYADRPRFGGWEPDLMLAAVWEGRTIVFAVEIKSVVRPRALSAVVGQLKQARAALPADVHPLLVTSYLSEDKLEQLYAAGLSGVDLCRNGVVLAPGLCVFRVGGPNPFREGPGVLAACRGDSSLVPRAFFRRASFDSITDLHHFIRQLGGKVSIATVSKAASKLVAEGLLERSGRSALDVPAHDVLLETLVEAYQPKRYLADWSGRVALNRPALLEGLAAIDREFSHPALAIGTGLDVIDGEYRQCEERAIGLYTSSLHPHEVIDRLQPSRKPAAPQHAVNLEIRQMGEQAPFFDRRGLLTSPLQAYLDAKREDRGYGQERIERLRDFVLKEAEGNHVILLPPSNLW